MEYKGDIDDMIIVSLWDLYIPSQKKTESKYIRINYI